MNVVVSDLSIGTVIFPRTEASMIISRLAEFEWFHKIDIKNEMPTKEIDDLLLKAQKIYQSIDEVIKGLQINYDVGILEILFKGTSIQKKKYEVYELKKILEDLESHSYDVIDEAVTNIHKLIENKKILEEYDNVITNIKFIKKLDIDFSILTTSKYFCTEFFVINQAEYNEIVRTLDRDIVIYKYNLDDKNKVAIVIISQREKYDKILKIMRSFNANTFSIPDKFPQSPNIAYLTVNSKKNELIKKQQIITKRLSKITKESKNEILRVYEAAMVIKNVLEILRKPGGTKLFAAIQGYIPQSKEKKFKKLTEKWVSITEYVSEKEKVPILFNNPKFVKTFEVITESQGIPKKKELDPTPMIAIMWPIFYGIMFADLGHGLLLMSLGLLFKLKGSGSLSRWGMLIAISGASASIAGVGAGEMFGFHVEHLEPFGDLLHDGGIFYSVSWLVGIISVAELNFDQVITILKVSIFLGIVHLVSAFILRIIMLNKEKKNKMIFMEAIPNLALYFGIVSIMMCAIGSGYDVMNMYSEIHTEPVPWITVFLGSWAQVWIIVRISIMIVIASVIIMIIGGIKHAKEHPEEGSDPASVLMEVLLGKTIECLAHTISYARIGIMLLVHAALLLTVNNAYESLGGIESPGAIVLIIGGNLGIMMIEGLIVYIQSLRLHLYEFFTKWYDGGAQKFNKIMLETKYNKLSWKKIIQ